MIGIASGAEWEGLCVLEIGKAVAILIPECQDIYP